MSYCYNIILIFILLINFVSYSVDNDKTKDNTANGFDFRDYVNFSIFYPISTNQTKKIDTFLNLSLLYNRVGSSIIDISSGISNTENVPFFQISGIGNYHEHHFKKTYLGMHFGGMYNLMQGKMNGIQVSGLLNSEKN